MEFGLGGPRDQHLVVCVLLIWHAAGTPGGGERETCEGVLGGD